MIRNLKRHLAGSGLLRDLEDAEINLATIAVGIAITSGSAPASAASMNCSSANLTKVGAMVDTMSDGPDRWAAFHEISAAQDDLLAGRMGSCAKHVGKVMKTGMMKPAGM